MKLDVPYYSQFLDIDDKFWMLRACGAVAMKSVAEFHGVTMSGLVTLCEEAKESGGYDMTNGWVHDYIVTRLQESGLMTERKEGLTDINEIVSYLEESCPVIVSVEKRVLEQTRFHIIVLVGYEKDNEGKVTDFYYHESESTNKERGMYRKCTTEVFLNYWRGKLILGAKARAV